VWRVHSSSAWTLRNCFRILFVAWMIVGVFVSLGKKVKCTLLEAQRLCTGRTAYRGSRDIALPFHDHGTRSGWGVVNLRPLFAPVKDPVPIVQEVGWAPGPVLTGAENLAPTGIRSPDRPARSHSLYRLSYRAHVSLGAFAKLRDETISFVLSVRPHGTTRLPLDIFS
jgi:hypothetical protein